MNVQKRVRVHTQHTHTYFVAIIQFRYFALFRYDNYIHTQSGPLGVKKHLGNWQYIITFATRFRRVRVYVKAYYYIARWELIPTY